MGSQNKVGPRTFPLPTSVSTSEVGMVDVLLGGGLS